MRETIGFAVALTWLIATTAQPLQPDPTALKAGEIKAAIDLVNSEAKQTFEEARGTWYSVLDLQNSLSKAAVRSSGGADLKVSTDLHVGLPIQQLWAVERGTIMWASSYRRDKDGHVTGKPFELGELAPVVTDPANVDIDRRTHAYLDAYRRYLISGDAFTLDREALAIQPGPGAHEAAEIEKLFTFHPGDGTEFFEGLLSRNAGWFLYHRRHLESHLAYFNAFGHVHQAIGQPLSAGIGDWKGLEAEFRPLFSQLMQEDLAAARARAAEVQCAQGYAAAVDDVAKSSTEQSSKSARIDALTVDARDRLAPLTKATAEADKTVADLYEKVLRISSRRIEGIAFRVDEQELRTMGIFIVDAPPRGPAARTSKYAPLFRSIGPLVSEPQKTHKLFLIGPGLPRHSRSLYGLFSDDRQHVSYKLIACKGEAIDPDWVDAWNRGWKLATQGMSRQDAIDFNRDVPALLVEARLDGALGRPHELTVLGNNSSTGTWILSRGDVKAKLTLVRRRDPGRATTAPVSDFELFDPTQFVVLPEKIYLQIETDLALDIDEVPVAIGDDQALAHRGSSAVILARAVGRGKTLFRTGPVMFYTGGDKIRVGEPGVVYLPSKPGRLVMAKLADDALLATYPPVASARIVRAPHMPWSEALYRAGSDDRVANWHSFSNLVKGARPATDDELGEISHSILRGDSATATKIRLGHLAAMLELRDTFIEMMKEYQSELVKIDTPELAAGLLRDLAPHLLDENLPFGSIEVDGPHTTTLTFKMPVARLLDRDYLMSHFGLTEKYLSSPEYRQWVQQTFYRALDEYRKSVDNALAAAQATKDDDYDGLVQLTGRGFDPVVQRVLSQMVRLKDDGQFHTEWVTDPAARDWVQSIASLAKEAKAGKEYNKQLLSTVTMALSIPAALGEGTVAVALNIMSNLGMGADAAGELFDKVGAAVRGHSEIDFALGSSEVIEAERLDLARLEDKPLWQSATTLALSGIGIGADAWRAAAELSAASYARRAQALSNSKQRATDALRCLTAEDQAKTLRSIEFAQFLKAAGKPLSVEQEGAIELGAQLDAEARASFRDALQALRRETDDPYYAFGKPFFSVKTLPKMVRGPYVPDPALPNSGDLVTYTTPAKTTVTLQLGRMLGAGAFAQVYELKDSAGNVLPIVIKYMKNGRHDAVDLVRAIEYGSELLQSGPGPEIPQLRILYASHSADHPFLIQERLTAEMQNFSPVYHREEEVIKGLFQTYTDHVAKLDGVSGGNFTREHQRAVVRLFRQLADKGLFWEDGHLENMFFVRKADGTIEAGLLDQDRLIRVEDDPRNACSHAADLCLRSLRSSPDGGFLYVNSMEKCIYEQGPGPGNVAAWSPQMLNAKALEFGQASRAWIIYDREAGKFVANLIDPDIVEEFFPDFRKWVDYDFRKGPQPPVKPSTPSASPTPSRPVGAGTGTGGLGP